MRIKHILAPLAIVASLTLLSSCSTTKDQANPLSYFSDLQAQSGTLADGASFVKGQAIQPDDELVISIT